MASCTISISIINPPPVHLLRSPISLHLSTSSTSLHSFSSHQFLSNQTRKCALKTGTTNSSGSQDAYGSDLLRKPVTSPASDAVGEESSRESDDGQDRKGSGDGEGWVDWEDRILEDTVPLVGFVWMVLHSGKYESGDRLSPEHERTILERLLPYHPECAKKIGSGVDYITIGYHPDFESSRCLFIVQKDGQVVDFSYRKCVKGLIKKNYPLYADSFILRHFRRRMRSD